TCWGRWPTRPGGGAREWASRTRTARRSWRARWRASVPSTRSWCTAESGWTRSHPWESPTCGRCAPAAEGGETGEGGQASRPGSSTRRATSSRARTSRCSPARSRRPTRAAASGGPPAGGAAATRPGAPPCSSTRARRSTSRASRLPTTRASPGRARRSRRGRDGPCWSGCGARALVFPNDADDHPLHRDVALVHAQRAHRGIRGLEPDPAARLAIELLDRRARAVDQRHHGLAVVGLVALVHDDEVTVLDVLVDHGLAAHLEDVTAAAAREELVGHGEGVVAGHRFDGLSGRDQSEERQLRGAGLALGWHHLDGAALVMGAVDVALALQIREMLVHSGERAEREARGDFLEARREPVPRDVPGDEIEDLALTASERHAVSRTETED